MKVYAIHLCPVELPLVTPHRTCGQAALHTPCPPGYNLWHEWAARKARTHKQSRCPGCGRYLIWTSHAGMTA